MCDAWAGPVGGIMAGGTGRLFPRPPLITDRDNGAFPGKTVMTRVLGRLMSLEMAALGLCELALSFLVIYGMLQMPDVFPTLVEASNVAAAHAKSHDIANLAAVLALTIVLTAAALGLYRPEICAERRRLLLNAGAAGLLAFPAVLIVSGCFNIGWSRHSVLLLTKVQVVWLICILASRVIFNRVMRERWFIRRILVVGPPNCTARLRQFATGGRASLFEAVVPARGADTESGEDPLSLAALRRQRIRGVVVAGSAADQRRSIKRPAVVGDQPGHRQGAVAAAREAPERRQGPSGPIVNRRGQLEDNAVARSAARGRRSVKRPRLVAEERGTRAGTVAAPRKAPDRNQSPSGLMVNRRRQLENDAAA